MRYKWWASICSMHRYDPSCNLCASGQWYELDPTLVDTYKAIGVRVEEISRGGRDRAFPRRTPASKDRMMPRYDVFEICVSTFRRTVEAPDEIQAREMAGKLPYGEEVNREHLRTEIERYPDEYPQKRIL